MTLREAFPEYYPMNDSELQQFWNEAIIVPDTNVLLDLYRVTRPSAVALLDFLESIKDKLFFPNQVVFEFARGRARLISDQISELTGLRESLNKALGVAKSVHLGEIASEIEAFTEQGKLIEKGIDKEISAQKSRMNGEDELYTRVLAIMGDHVGFPLSDEKMEEVLKTGDDRYEKRIPPGFGDKAKDEKPDSKIYDSFDSGRRRFGDLIVWFQMLEEAQRQKRPVIFVTKDTKKDDWFLELSGVCVGPRIELRREAQVLGVTFWSYSLESFNIQVGKYLGQSLPDQAEEELNHVQPGSNWAGITPSIVRLLGNMFMDAASSAPNITVTRLTQLQAVALVDWYTRTLKPRSLEEIMGDIAGLLFPNFEVHTLPITTKRYLLMEAQRLLWAFEYWEEHGKIPVEDLMQDITNDLFLTNIIDENDRTDLSSPRRRRVRRIKQPE